jgi:hypothetical protein
MGAAACEIAAVAEYRGRSRGNQEYPGRERIARG